MLRLLLFIKRFLIVALIFFIGLAFHVSDNEPKMDFEIEWHDFGNVSEGNNVFYDFIFTNTGTQPLIISNVDAGCSCTVPEWPKEPIMPGKTGVIKVSYNSKDRSGVFNKAIRISSNAEMPTKIIRIKGVVE
jgi:hypothetical protein